MQSANNVLAVVTRFIVVAEMLLLGLFARPRNVADVQKPNAYDHFALTKLDCIVNKALPPDGGVGKGDKF